MLPDPENLLELANHHKAEVEVTLAIDSIHHDVICIGDNCIHQVDLMGLKLIHPNNQKGLKRCF